MKLEYRKSCFKGGRGCFKCASEDLGYLVLLPVVLCPGNSSSSVLYICESSKGLHSYYRCCNDICVSLYVCILVMHKESYFGTL
jgi:hypothetical protein